jgi:hypothetical protein
MEIYGIPYMKKHGRLAILQIFFHNASKISSDMKNICWKANYSLVLSSQIWTNLLFVCQLPGKVRPVPVVLAAGLLLLPPSPQHGLVLQVSLLQLFTWACIQSKEMRERVDLMESTLFHKHSFRGLGADTLTCCESTHFVSISRIFCSLTCNYFHKELIDSFF